MRQASNFPSLNLHTTTKRDVLLLLFSLANIQQTHPLLKASSFLLRSDNPSLTPSPFRTRVYFLFSSSTSRERSVLPSWSRAIRSRRGR